MSDEKPTVDGTQQPAAGGPAPAEAPAAPVADQQSNFLEALSEDGKAYLKGLGVESLDPQAFAKIVDSSIKQKTSVSEKSRELEELRARLSSQGQDTTVTPVADPTPEPQPDPVTQPAPSTPVQGRGVTENDLFDLSSMINREFPELIPEAADGRLFAELRQLGFFGVEGINKKQVYEHLSQKHATAKELKELREFKEKHSVADPSLNPTYNPGAPVTNPETKDANWAREIVSASIMGHQVEEKVLGEARRILQEAI